MPKIYEVEVIEEDQHYSLQQVCEAIHLDSEFITQCVDFGIAETQHQLIEEWSFSVSSIVRLQKAYRLQRDLNINFTGLGLVLDLLEDVEQLHAEVGVLKKKLKHWESV
ncbi:chaperone modulator CbpM [Gammaproteobacteria bacterium]|nr:chaperone modulator CbpM [Gammaproteobacteria bacterium]